MPGFDPDEFEKDISGYRRQGKMRPILEGLAPADAELLEGALRDLSIPANRIAVALRNQGFDLLTAAPVLTWRKHNVSS